MSDRWRAVAGVALAGAVALVVALLAGGDENGQGPGSPQTATDSATESPEGGEPPASEPAAPGPGSAAPGPDPDPDPSPDEVEEGPSGPAPATADERAAVATVRAYVQALDRRDGERLCRLFEPAALNRVDFPRGRPTCAGQVAASLGHDPGGGLPVWRGSELTRDVSARVSGNEARVVATIFTRYRGVREPSIEDDIVHLARAGAGGWRVAKPSVTFYRAIGEPDPPLDVLAPPRG